MSLLPDVEWVISALLPFPVDVAVVVGVGVQGTVVVITDDDDVVVFCRL